MKRLIAVSALLTSLAIPAIAQSTTVTPKSDMAPAVGMGTSKSDVTFYSQRGDWRASKLMGVKVSNMAGETVGDVNDVLIDKDGKVAAIVIGVGGFLGMGERHAAVSFSSLQLTRDANGNPLAKANLTKEQLKAAPEWTWQAASAE
jgi:sporulation protein YlmC with PRC-barrel domain